MARTTNRYRFSVDFRMKGDFGRVELQGRLEKAQERNAKLWEAETRRRAQADIKHAYRFPPRKRRGPSMVSLYRTTITDRGRELRLTNPTLRAKLFEEGARPHRIRATGTGTNRRGRITSGAKLLRFKTSPGGRWISKREVRHPGQRGKYPILKARRALEPVFERNIAEEMRRGIEGRGRVSVIG